MTFRAYSIGFSAALLALACGSNDSNNTPGSVDTTPLPPPVVAPAQAPTPDNVGGTATPVTTTPVTAKPSAGSDIKALAKAAAENVLAQNCGECHGSQLALADAFGNMNYIDNTDELVTTGKLKPLDSANSLVIQRMEDGSMPPPQLGKTRVKQSDIDTVIQYIDSPAFWPDTPSLGNTCTDQSFSFDDLYTAVERDLLEANNDDGLRFRYISLTNRFTAGVCADTSLDRDRQALFKMVNALSTIAKVTPPRAINPEETIYRIDLKDYNWDRAISVNGVNFVDVWEAIIANNPYAVEFVGDQADIAKQESNTTVPVMFSDSMLDVATIGNLYYAIIGVDVNQTLPDFILNTLQVDVAQNLIDEDQLRAGTTQSILSKQDRAIERDDLELTPGALWQSFDFLADVQNDSIFEKPFDFVAGGTEAIFSLPNGMFGYIIADGAGVIKEDSDILLDRFQDNNRAITSVSCSSCHASGLIPVVDEVRQVALDNAINFNLNNDQVDQLKTVYASPDDFARVANDDTAAYQRALSAANVPLKGADPLSAVFLQFDTDLKINVAAGDLGVTSDFLENNINKLDPSLGQLRNATIDRDDFTAVYVNSLCILSITLDNAPDVNVCDAAAAALLQ